MPGKKKKRSTKRTVNNKIKVSEEKISDELIDEIDKEKTVLNNDNYIEDIKTKEPTADDVIGNLNEMIDDINKSDIQRAEIKEKPRHVKRTTKKPLRDLLILLLKIVILGGMLFIIFGFIFGLKRMDSLNMNPNLKEGDLLLYYRINQVYRENDIIVIDNNGKQQVYRIVATTDQTVDFNQEGQLLIDGYPETETTYYKTGQDDKSKIKFPYKVNDNEYFVLNDLRTDTNYSRTFGSIKKSQIKGKVIGKIQIRNL